MTGIADTDYQKSIAAAVRAEFGRNNNNSITRLASVIGKSRPTASSRWHGKSGYTAGELDDIARYLGISVYDLNDSARMGDEFGSRNTSPEVARITPPQDDWAQPARSKRRAS
jgi:hypothetical protein